MKAEDRRSWGSVTACFKPIFYCVSVHLYPPPLKSVWLLLLLVMITIFDYIQYFEQKKVYSPICFLFTLLPVIWRGMRLLTDCHYCSLSVPVLFSFPLFSVSGWPALMFLLSSRSSPPKWDGEESMKTFERFVLLNILCSSASHWALNREAAQGFRFFITFSAKPSLHCLCSPFDKSPSICFILLLCNLSREGRVVFSVRTYCWVQSSLRSWMIEGQMLSRTW